MATASAAADPDAARLDQRLQGRWILAYLPSHRTLQPHPQDIRSIFVRVPPRPQRPFDIYGPSGPLMLMFPAELGTPRARGRPATK